MNLDLYHFDLPEELIARYPVDPPDSSRLLHLSATGATSHSIFRQLPDLLHDGDVLVFNRTRVSKRRLFLKRQSGAEIEALFLEHLADASHWRCMVRKAGRLAIGEILTGHNVRFRVSKREGSLTVLQSLDKDDQPVSWTETGAEEFFEKNGHPPIPPYLNRPAEELDHWRYQTIFAQKPGSVAAPTAGLHFTPALMAELERRFRIAWIDLTIGYGTFAPLQPEHFTRRRLHREVFEIPAHTAELLQTVDRSRERVVAVGTTTLRALESVERAHGGVVPGSFETDLFLFPPDTVRSCDVLLTNFHLPASSLFLLVCAFGGTQRLQRAYAEAIENRYRFFSYGDAMLVEKQ